MPDGDLIATVLRNEIEQFRLANFDTFELYVLIHPSSRAKPITDADGIQIGFDEYDFEQWSRPPKPIKVGLSRSGPRIWYMKQWQPVNAFLEHVKPEWNNDGDFSTSKSVQLRREQQARWWLANGKSFQLLNLPAEIRNIIYGYALGPVVEPYPAARARRLGPSTYTRSASRPNFDLLRTCKLVHKEASDILFHFTRKYSLFIPMHDITSNPHK